MRLRSVDSGPVLIANVPQMFSQLTVSIRDRWAPGHVVDMLCGVFLFDYFNIYIYLMLCVVCAVFNSRNLKPNDHYLAR